MTNSERHQARSEHARLDGYRHTAIPDAPEWCGEQLSDAIDNQAAEAALALRGIKPTTSNTIYLRDAA